MSRSIAIIPGRITIKQIRYFIAVADARSFSQASKNLYVSQPTITVALQKLAKDLNATLIKSGPNGYEITDSGLLIYEEGSRILHEMAEIQNKIFDIENSGTLNLRLGFTHLFCLQFMEKLISFMRHHPNINITLVQTGSKKIQKLVLEQEINMAVVSYPQYYEGLTIEPVKTIKNYEIGIVMHPSNPLAQKESVEWADVKYESFSTLGADYVVNDLLHKQSKKLGFIPNIVFVNDNEEILVNSVEQLQSVCIIPIAMQDSFPNHDLVWVPFTDKEATIPIGIATRSDSEIGECLAHFKEIIQS